MGYYQITINNNIYTVEQNFDLFDNGWQIEIEDEIIDIASTLKQAKQVIQEVEDKQKGNNGNNNNRKSNKSN